ncbi:MAG: aminotransferase class III-fold pyridoxal phosphate-dependent enzyme [Pseudomonadota bacterium]
MSETVPRIGFLFPADGLNDDEFWRFLPPNVLWLTARYTAGAEEETLTRNGLDQYADPAVLARAAALLAPAHPDVIACGDHAGSIMRGIDGENALRAAMGPNAVTMGGAAVEAIRRLGAYRIALVSPYSEEITARLEAFLVESGLMVQSRLVMGAASEEEIGPRSAKWWANEIIDWASGCGLQSTDCVLLAGGGVRFAGAIVMAEAVLGRPIVTGPGALVFAAATAAGVDPRRAGLGALYQPVATASIDVVARRQSRATKTFALGPSPPVFVSGSGAYLIAEDGRRYLDFACGSGTTSLGHGHPAIERAVTAQIASGVTHVGPHFNTPAQALLYERLGGILPDHLTHFHPCVSGAEATEAAIKAAMHVTGARRFVAFDGSYHGRSLGALALSAERGANAALAPFEPPVTVLPFPRAKHLGEAAAAAIEAMVEPLAGVIIETVQATAGLRVADPDGLKAIAAAAQSVGAPLIVDEVFTGFGRTGRWFDFERVGLAPDLVLLGKSLGGGSPAGLLAGTHRMLTGWPQGAQSATFQLHPLAAQAALAFIETLERQSLVERAQTIGVQLSAHLETVSGRQGVTATRVAGAFGAVEMRDGEAARTVRAHALERGLITWGCGVKGEAIGLVPPLTVSPREIDRAMAILLEALNSL